MSASSKFVLAGVLAAGGVALAGCGSSGSSPAAAATVAVPTSAPASAPGSADPSVSTTTSTASSSAPTGGGSSDANTCALVPLATVSSLTGHPLTTATSSVLSPGAQQCLYADASGEYDVTVIVYQANSGVTFADLQSQVSGTTSASAGIVMLTGIGDKAFVGPIDLDVQAGSRFIDVSGAGGTLEGSYTAASKIATMVVAALGS